MEDSPSLENYKITKKIGGGSFGQIFEAIDLRNEETLAVKLEDSSMKRTHLLYEAKLYSYLHQDYKVLEKGIPKVYYYASLPDYNIMVMDLLGPSLENLFAICQKKFSMKTVLMIADQALTRLEYLHTKSFLHRDIKPDNLLMGMGKKAHKLFMIDFGLAKKYSKNGEHINFKDKKELLGTAKFASVSTHLGYEQSRRDDLESLGYVLIYFLRGNLPWQNAQGNNKFEKYSNIREKKLATTEEDLCAGLPQEFVEYLKYCKNLKFEETPDYKSLKDKFKTLFFSLQLDYDFMYDWNLIVGMKVNRERRFEEEKVSCSFLKR